MTNITTSRGYAIHDTKDYKNFKVIEYPLKREEAQDVTVHVECCGTCGSDHHTISGGWGPLTHPEYIITGHEIVGKVVQVGPEVTEFKVGDRVGIGAQAGSCGKCNQCQHDNENYCPVSPVDTYNGKWPNGDYSQGGYSTHVRVQEKFVFSLPENLKSEDAASMLCAGITSASPLFRNNVGEGSKVGVVGLGGLGHYAVLFAIALGAEVTVFSHSERKKDDALKMGAKHFVTTTGDFAKEHAMSLDLIICTASNASLPLNELISCLVPQGKFVWNGMPETDWPALRSQTMAGNGAFIGSSHIGSKAEIMRMLQIAADKNIKPWITTRPMKEAAQSIEDVETGRARYRTILIQDIDQ
ncbi:alcohol dehydrogenase [Naganishia albida]|nr:alcohol dehydrogenase [Naganishia albida]